MLIKITDVPPYDGDYPLTLDSLTGQELHLIKIVSGVRANEIQGALEAGDYDLLVAFTMIAIERSGKRPPTAEMLLAAAVGQILVEEDEPAEGEDVRPPASSPTPNGNENSTGAGAEDNAATTPSGATSSATGGQPRSRLQPIGGPGSADSADSDRETSVA